MELRIGVQNVAREIVIETDQPREEISAAVTKSLSENTPLEIKDAKGRVIIVPAQHLGYVDIGESTARPVGFVAG